MAEIGTAADRVARLLDRIPLGVVAGMLVVGAALSEAHVLLLHDGASLVAQWPQWLGRISLQLYFIILPVAMLALWARRRDTLGRLGRAAAWMIAPQAAGYATITVAAMVWDGVLGRGDLPALLTPGLEHGLIHLFYLGTVALGLSYWRDRGAPRSAGPLLVLALVLSFVAVGALTVVMTVLATVVLRTGLVRARAGSDSALRDAHTV